LLTTPQANLTDARTLLAEQRKATNSSNKSDRHAAAYVFPVSEAARKTLPSRTNASGIPSLKKRKERKRKKIWLENPICGNPIQIQPSHDPKLNQRSQESEVGSKQQEASESPKKRKQKVKKPGNPAPSIPHSAAPLRRDAWNDRPPRNPSEKPSETTQPAESRTGERNSSNGDARRRE
jgi:hypothetical protein